MLRGYEAAPLRQCLLFGALILLAERSAAQTDQPARPGPWQASVFGGWYSGGPLYRFQGVSSDEVRLEGAGSYGLRLEFAHWRRFGLELDWSRARPNVAFVKSSRGVIGGVPLDTFLLHGNLFFGAERLCGLLSLGFGGAYISPYVPGAPSGDTNFTASLGLGGKAFLDRHVGVRVDARALETYVNVSPQTPVYCEPSGGCYFYKRNWFLAYEVAGGMVYAF